MGKYIMCPACNKEFDSFLNLATHMVLKGGLEGEHVKWLEGFLRVPPDRFTNRSDKKIANTLSSYWKKHRAWPLID
jgi:hypothetical protein